MVYVSSSGGLLRLFFAESDVVRLLADTQTSSSLRSQQALVDVASRSAGARPRRSSPRRSPARQSPGRRRWESGSPAHSGFASTPLRLALL